jgi:hypothetical protein
MPDRPGSRLVGLRLERELGQQMRVVEPDITVDGAQRRTTRDTDTGETPHAA